MTKPAQHTITLQSNIFLHAGAQLTPPYVCVHSMNTLLYARKYLQSYYVMAHDVRPSVRQRFVRSTVTSSLFLLGKPFLVSLMA